MIKTYPRNAKNIPNKQIRSNIYSAFKPISDEIHNNVGFALNLSNILGLSLINAFFAGNIPFSPNKPRSININVICIIIFINIEMYISIRCNQYIS